MKICIILNGEITDYKSIKQTIVNNNYDYIICADGGANHAYNMGIIPSYIIGDLDSICNDTVEYYKNYGVKFEEFPSKKNETDTELCIYLANQLDASNIDFFGALGGRVDHMLVNINLLFYVRSMNIQTKIISDKEDIYIAIDEEVLINGNKGDIVSIIPIKSDAVGVTLKDLEYPLNDYNMKYSLSLGMSNIMIKSICSINVKKGSLLIIKNKQKR
ncbi:MAG: thiamine diphosphokinase [Romboutsia sp.]